MGQNSRMNIALYFLKYQFKTNDLANRFLSKDIDILNACLQSSDMK